MGAKVDIRLLGALELLAGGRSIDLGPAKQRVLLAATAVDAGQPVTVDTLTDRIWDSAPPAEARSVLHTYVARVRRILADAQRDAALADDPLGGRGVDHGGPVTLQRRAGGYQLIVEADRIDVHRFRRLVEQARTHPVADPERAALLDEALRLWRGEALTGVTGAWAARIRHGLEQQRLSALADWAGTEVARGRYPAVIERLPGPVAEHPLAEALAARLLEALHLAGRDTEALEVYAEVRARIAEELGAEPGPALRDLYQLILHSRSNTAGTPPPQPETVPVPAPPTAASPTAASPTVAPPTAAPPTAGREPAAPATAAPPTAGTTPASAVPVAAVPVAAAPGSRPAQLPLAMSGFVGRQGDLARLDAIAASAAGQPTAVVIAAVWGTAGVGKSTLAVQWAQRVRDGFPDGQLYVNLRGFGPSDAPMGPAEAIRGFLDALGVAQERIPASVDAQAGLYRSLIAGQRVLVLLDNARDAEQVRPLLPGTPGCLVIVTSRHQLSSLVATEGAYPVPLELLRPDESRQLLAVRLGPTRAIPAEAVDEIVARCAGLPLALAIVAARAASSPRVPLAALADELRSEEPHGLDALDAGDPGTDMRGVFSWSYRSLAPPVARLFRLLGLHPGPDLSVPAAANLAGVPIAEARSVLAELGSVHLVSPHGPGRYTLHDLLRAYAAELARAELGTPEADDALGRMLDYYLHTTHVAADLLHPGRPVVASPPARDDVLPERMTRLDEAVAWFTAEYPVLVALVRLSTSRGYHRHSWQLARHLQDFLDRRRLWYDQATVQEFGLRAARETGDRGAQAYAHRMLGRVRAEMGEHAAADDHYRRALDLFAELGDHQGQAKTHMSIAVLARRREQRRESLAHHLRARELFELAGDAPGRANALNNIAMNEMELGDLQSALGHCIESLQVIRDIGDTWAEGSTWDSLGGINHHLGRYPEAVNCYLRALDLIRRVGDRYHESVALLHLADTYEATGDAAGAADSIHAASRILDELGHPDAAQVRARITARS
jgi:DNA-binding SARP family transcriptional activator/tetratricopeptide (TPR) repeat protein